MNNIEAVFFGIFEADIFANNYGFRVFRAEHTTLKIQITFMIDVGNKAVAVEV